MRVFEPDIINACTFFMKKKSMNALYKPVSERIINKILSEE